MTAAQPDRRTERRFTVVGPRDLRGVADRWRAMYKRTKNQDSIEIGNRLAELKNPTAEQVDTIVGNKSWAHHSCSSCYTYVDSAISFGEDETVTICGPCLDGALKALNANGRQS